MANQTLIHLNSDLLTIILSHFLLESFYDFSTFCQVWLPFQSTEKIWDVFARLWWINVYKYYSCPDYFERERVLQFIHHCAVIQIEPVVLYICSKQMFLRQNIKVNLFVLSGQFAHHVPSFFTSSVFRAIHHPLTIYSIVRELFQALRTPHMLYQADEVINILATLHGKEYDFAMSVKKLYPSAKRSNMFDSSTWPPFTEIILQSLCGEACSTFSASAMSSTTRISVEHISKCKCPYCAIQMILFKIYIDFYKII